MKKFLNINSYNAVIFDWDGTLVDTCDLILDAHNHVRQHFDLELWTMDDFLGQASKSAREYYPEIYGENADQAQEILYEFVGEHHLSYLSPMTGALELLEQLKASHRLAVVSNKRHDFLCKEIEHLGWESYFDSVIGAGFAAKDKPAPDPLLDAMNNLDAGLEPQDVLYIGDTETDLLCARNAKCPVAFIQSDKPRPDLIKKYQPDFSYHSLKEFIQDIKKDAPFPANKAC
ncbi:MAG: HAD family hydrolase [Alphaproteobacteria bacterium]|nr:HAD family hydrolase [Alphaproteobacteria bacterium]